MPDRKAEQSLYFLCHPIQVQGDKMEWGAEYDNLALWLGLEYSKHSGVLFVSSGLAT
jgi:hypothetical protein